MKPSCSQHIFNFFFNVSQKQILQNNAVRDAEDSEELAADFKVLPMAERGSGENEPEQEGGRREILGLVGEGKPIILGVE